jgi:hypothetical protein
VVCEMIIEDVVKTGNGCCKLLDLIGLDTRHRPCDRVKSEIDNKDGGTGVVWRL